MRSDWMVWLGCFLLFGCGAVWAQIPIKTNFFVVDNVHDLFEILGALATVVAVCVAAANINSWKHQISAAADLELARKMSSALIAYKDKMQTAWLWAEQAIEQFGLNDGSDQPLSMVFEDDFETFWSDLYAVQKNLDELLLNCLSAWRLDMRMQARLAFQFSQRCKFLISNYSMYLKDFESSSSANPRLMKSVRTHWSWFEKKGCQDYQGASDYIQKVISEIERSVEKKLLIS